MFVLRMCLKYFELGCEQLKRSLFEPKLFTSLCSYVMAAQYKKLTIMFLKYVHNLLLVASPSPQGLQGVAVPPITLQFLHNSLIQNKRNNLLYSMSLKLLETLVQTRNLELVNRMYLLL